MSKTIRTMFAAIAAVILILSASLGMMAQAESNQKHFSVVEAAAQESALTIPEIAQRARTSVVAVGRGP